MPSAATPGPVPSPRAGAPTSRSGHPSSSAPPTVAAASTASALRRRRSLPAVRWSPCSRPATTGTRRPGGARVADHEAAARHRHRRDDDGADRDEMPGQRHAGRQPAPGRRRRAHPGSRPRAAVHDRAAHAPLVGGAVGVHRDVHGGVGSPDHGQREEQQHRAGSGAGRPQAGAESERRPPRPGGYRGDRSPPRHRTGRQRADRHAREHPAQPDVEGPGRPVAPASGG